jgi:hypothetical protein
MKTDKQFVNALEDHLRQWGAPDKLISDRAQVEISRKVVDILCAYCTDNWQSEPHKQYQNPAERRYHVIKTMTNTIMDRTGAPAYTCLLCMMYLCFILNFSVSTSLNFETPMKRATGFTPDISALLCFVFMEPVYYQAQEPGFPSKSREKRGYFVGIAEHVGHAMTFKILTDNTKRVINHSNICSAKDPKSSNLRMDPLVGEISPPIIKSRDDPVDAETKPHTPVFHTSDLVRSTFLMDEREDGQRHRAHIVQAIADHASFSG